MAILLYGIIALAAGLIYHFILYPAFFSPLASIPSAHWSSPFSNAWILLARFGRRESRTIHAAHQRLGPVVRLGPTELAVNDLLTLKTIYVGGWEKSQWYMLFTNYWGVTNMFTKLGAYEHSIRKRQLSNIYAKSHLQRTPVMHDIVDEVVKRRFLGVIDGAAKTGASIEVYDLLSRMAMDVISSYIFGISVGTNMVNDSAEFLRLMKSYMERSKNAFISQELPGLLGVARRLSLPPFTATVVRARNLVDGFCLELCNRTSEKIDKGEIGHEEAIVFKQLRKYDETPSVERKGTEVSTNIASELLDHLLAGFETTAIGLTYALYRLSMRKDIQQELRRELRSLEAPFVDKADAPLPSPTEIDRLPFLNAVLMETLRLNASIPGPQPRVSPAGAFLKEYGPLPAGVRVSAQAYSLHRNEEIFPDPEKWDPHRWIHSENMAEMMRWFWAFSSGGRMCIGSHLALLESKMALAAIYTNFESRVEDASGIGQEDAYTASPTGNVYLGFDRIAM